MLTLSASHLAAVGALVLLSAYAASVDLRFMIIPDAVNVVIFATGFFCSIMLGTVTPAAALLGTLLGAGLLLAVRTAFRARHGYDGLGLGDVKFMGAAGPWIGADGIPVVLLVACGTALSYVALRRAADPRFDGQDPLAFAPFLAIGVTFAAATQILTGVTWLDILDAFLRDSPIH